jgi:hypothetical protein
VRGLGRTRTGLAAERKAFANRLAERPSMKISMKIPAEDPDYGDLGRAFPDWHEPDRDAILQPPKPEIRAASERFMLIFGAVRACPDQARRVGGVARLVLRT